MKFNKKKVKISNKAKKYDGCSLIHKIVETLIYDHIEENDLDEEFIDEIIKKIMKKYNNTMNIKNIKIDIKNKINNLIKRIPKIEEIYVPILNSCSGSKKYCVNINDRSELKKLIKMIN